MKEKITKVRTDGKIVAEISIPLYESLAEVKDAFTEAVILEKFNRINTIDLQAEERNKHVPARIGKEKKRLLAFNLCTADELIAIAGDANKLAALLDSKIPQVEEQLAANAVA